MDAPKRFWDHWDSERGIGTNWKFQNLSFCKIIQIDYWQIIAGLKLFSDNLNSSGFVHWGKEKQLHHHRHNIS